MNTIVLPIDPVHPSAEAIAQAAATIRDGRLVAFPTETVYGLGADALDPAAVAGIYLAKGRPATNPVIVHLPDIDAARQLVTVWPESAKRLAARFWPGPLSIVLPRQAHVPDIVTAGGSTVALRVPAHPIALALLRAAAVPIAAPSANCSNELSPTRAEHVLRGLDQRIDLLLDGGPSSGGLESTVIDLTTDPPRLLRPGLVSLAELRAILGRVEIASAAVGEAPLRSPGQLSRHYAPRTPAVNANDGERRVRELAGQGLRVGWLTRTARALVIPGVEALVLADDPIRYAAELYAALHTLDVAGLDRIVIDQPPMTEDWLAIHDRLNRAAVNSRK